MASSIYSVDGGYARLPLQPSSRSINASATPRTDIPKALMPGVRRHYSIDHSNFTSTQSIQSIPFASSAHTTAPAKPTRTERHRTLPAYPVSRPDALSVPPVPTQKIPANVTASAVPSNSTGSIHTDSSTGSAHLRIGLALSVAAEEGAESDEEDPFHFDQRTKAEDIPISAPVTEATRPPMPVRASTEPTARPRPRTTELARSLMNRASIAPLPSTTTSTSSSSASSAGYSSTSTSGSRFSLMRTQTEDGDMVIQEVEDEEGRRWSLSVPADGLPEDMLRMLEELESLARELTSVLPRIVVTQSAQSLGVSTAAFPVMEPTASQPTVGPISPSHVEDTPVPLVQTHTQATSRWFPSPAAESTFSLPPLSLPQEDNAPVAELSSLLDLLSLPPPASPLTGILDGSFAEEPKEMVEDERREQSATTITINPKGKNRMLIPVNDNTRPTEDIAKGVLVSVDQVVSRDTQAKTPQLPPGLMATPKPSSEPRQRDNKVDVPPPIAQAALPTDPSMHCIYLPDMAPEFLTGSSTSPIAEPAEGFHSPGRPMLTARQRAKTLSHASPRSAAFFAALDEAATARSSVTPGPGRPVVSPPAVHRAHSASPVKAQPAYRIPEPTVHPLEQRRARGKSLLQLRSKSSKISLRSHTPDPEPPLGVSQMPAYKWSSSHAVRDLAAAQQAALIKEKEKEKGGGFKALFRSKTSRSVSEPPPYQPPPHRAGGGKMRHASEERSLPPMPPMPPEPSPSTEGRRLVRMPSARDLFKKMK